jgi:hypothetical protein
MRKEDVIGSPRLLEQWKAKQARRKARREASKGEKPTQKNELTPLGYKMVKALQQLLQRGEPDFSDVEVLDLAAFMKEKQEVVKGALAQLIKTKYVSMYEVDNGRPIISRKLWGGKNKKMEQTQFDLIVLTTKGWDVK